MTLRVGVIGAGVVGCCIALALRKRGAAVTLIDREEPGSGCSFGNSGALSPGSVAPLAMPGVLATVPGMLASADSPLYLPWTYLPRALPWLVRFVASSSSAKVQATAARLAALHAHSIERHESLAEEAGVAGLFLKQGHLHLYRDAASLEKDRGAWRLREQHGYRAERLDRAGVLALEPNIGERYSIGMLLADHATITDPFRYVQAIARRYVALGGQLVRARVDRIAANGPLWHVETTDAVHPVDAVVVAAGAWSARLLRPLGVRLSLESQRGYHVQFDGGRDLISRTVVLTDRKAFLAPMQEGLRIGGNVEIAGLDRAPDSRRSDLLERIARETFPALAERPARSWMGHRPCMPDSVPFVGPAPGRPGVWIATGHGHLGLTDSVNTAEQISEALLGPRSD
ncbi:FAD-binding oxidoreductase [soil metagenome]